MNGPIPPIPSFAPPDRRGKERLGRCRSARGPSVPRGFTLLEVLVALAIMAIAAALVIQLFSADLRAIARSGDVTSATVRGDSRIREILAEPTLEENAWSEETDDGYRLDIAVAEVLKRRTENLPVKMMEVELTVRWREGVKERSLRLKTMKMIDKAAPTAAYYFGNKICQSRHSGESRNPELIKLDAGSEPDPGPDPGSGMTC